ncbi:hypothetical protein ACUV84_028451 [Puccinellia chinampoensis]
MVGVRLLRCPGVVQPYLGAGAAPCPYNVLEYVFAAVDTDADCSDEPEVEPEVALDLGTSSPDPRLLRRVEGTRQCKQTRREMVMDTLLPWASYIQQLKDNASGDMGSTCDYYCYISLQYIFRRK